MGHDGGWYVHHGDAARLVRARKLRLWTGFPFRTVELNGAGWSAVLGSGLAAGVAVAAVTRRPGPAALGPVATLAAVLVADHCQWRRMWTSHVVDDTAVELVADVLRSGGIEVEIFEQEGEDVDAHGGTATSDRGIRYRQADARRVRRLLRRRSLVSGRRRRQRSARRAPRRS